MAGSRQAGALQGQNPGVLPPSIATLPPCPAPSWYNQLGRVLGLLAVVLEGRRGGTELMDIAEILPGELGAPSVLAPSAAESSQGHGTVGSTHGGDIWGQQKLEKGSRRRAGSVSAGQGDNLCPGQLFPSSTSFLPLAGQWGKAAAAVAWEQEQLWVPVLCLGTISAGQSLSQGLWREVGLEQLSSFALGAAVLARLCLRALSLLLFSPLKRETGRAQLCCVSWKFRLQLCKCPEVLHPPWHSSLHTECELLFKCLSRWILALRCCGQSTDITTALLC